MEGARAGGRPPAHRRTPRRRHVRGCAALLLLVAIALAGAPARASAESGAPPEGQTITTTLRPGWTMIAWLGPDATVAELFDAIPALERVSIWDAAGQHYASWPRSRVPRDGERRLTAGAGAWLRLGGDAAVEWTRPAASGGALLSLSAGANLVGWLGDDGTVVGAALARFGDALVRASRWDTESQRYLHYRPGAPPARTRSSISITGRGSGSSWPVEPGGGRRARPTSTSNHRRSAPRLNGPGSAPIWRASWPSSRSATGSSRRSSRSPSCRSW